jgi:hypothetical protein
MPDMKIRSFFPLLLIITFTMTALYPEAADAQLERERVVTDAPIDNVFWSGTNIGLSTVRNLAAKNLNSSVLHTFGLTNGGIDRFWGLDDGANTRIGLEYGITDEASVGIGRMAFRNVVDVRGKFNILQQTRTGNVPIEVAVKANIGITTLAGIEWEFTDRISYLTSVMVARKFNRFSFQLSPMMAHFNRVWSEGEQRQLYGVGILLNADLNERFSLSGEYLPVFGDRNPGTSDAMGIALNIDTGGHIFQIFLTSSQWHNEQYIMANNRDRFWDGDFRIGFNINRMFGLGN